MAMMDPGASHGLEVWRRGARVERSGLVCVKLMSAPSFPK